MTGSSLVDSAPVPTGRRRREVLSVLHRAAQPLSVTDVAAQTGLHANTARFHLDALVTAGLADRSTEPRETPGRPRMLYRAHAGTAGPRSYGLLAEMLTGLVAALPDGAPAATETGRAWGRHLVERAAPSERVDAEESVARLNRLLDGVGFSAHTSRSGNGWEVRLHHCPFREVAQRHSDVVCALHLGLMRGALEELRAPVDAAELEPFATPDACVARLRPAAP